MNVYDINGNVYAIGQNAGGLEIKRNNLELVTEFLGVARSYLNKSDLVYADGNTIFYTDQATNGIDCSTYVILCLMGYAYELTPYYTHQYISPDAWKANSEFEWSINPREYKNSKYADDSATTEIIHVAAQIGRWMVERSQIVPLDNGFTDVLPGDIVFWARKDSQTGEFVHPTWYKKINHVGIILTKEDAPDTYVDSGGTTRNWDKTKYPYKHQIIDVRIETPPCQTLHWLEEGQEDQTNVYVNNVNTVCLVCRPDLGALQSARV